MKHIITAALIAAAVIAPAAHAEQYVSGDAPCSAWTELDSNNFKSLIETGYAVGFADSFSLTGMDTRRYRYGEVVAAITRECYRDEKQPIVVAATKAMRTFSK